VLTIAKPASAEKHRKVYDPEHKIFVADTTAIASGASEARAGYDLHDGHCYVKATSLSGNRAIAKTSLRFDFSYFHGHEIDDDKWLNNIIVYYQLRGELQTFTQSDACSLLVKISLEDMGSQTVIANHVDTKYAGTTGPAQVKDKDDFYKFSRYLEYGETYRLKFTVIAKNTGWGDIVDASRVDFFNDPPNEDYRVQLDSFVVYHTHDSTVVTDGMFDSVLGDGIADYTVHQNRYDCAKRIFFDTYVPDDNSADIYGWRTAVLDFDNDDNGVPWGTKRVCVKAWIDNLSHIPRGYPVDIHVHHYLNVSWNCSNAAVLDFHGWGQGSCWNASSAPISFQKEFEDIPACGWAILDPIPLAGGQYLHRFTMYNDETDRPVNIESLVFDPVPSTVENLGLVDFPEDARHYRFTILPKSSWTIPIITDNLYKDEYLHFMYKVLNSAGDSTMVQARCGHEIPDEMAPGPNWIVNSYDLFQDNFSTDGTITGTVRLDMAKDIAPKNSPTLQPGDSIAVTVVDRSGALATDGGGPAVYAHVSVRRPEGKPVLTGPDMEYPGGRYPYLGTDLHNGENWYKFRMDSVRTLAGTAVTDRFCFDLSDGLITPGDTIFYVFSATNDSTPSITNFYSQRHNGQGEGFVTESMSEAFDSPLEFTALPAAGYLRGGDILYVDDAGRGAFKIVDDEIQYDDPEQRAFDTAFEMLDIFERVDRYDVLGPANVSNGLASRAVNQAVQIMSCYKTIIWSSGKMSHCLIGDGNPNATEKSDDYSLLFNFLALHPQGPGVYISGNETATEWIGLSRPGALALRSTFMNFDLVDSVHTDSGEPLSPDLHSTATSSIFNDATIRDTLVAFGGSSGEPAHRHQRFDLIAPGGSSDHQIVNLDGTRTYALSQETVNDSLAVAKVFLSGFSFGYVHDYAPNGQYPYRSEFLGDILNWLGHIMYPTGVHEVSTYVNFLSHNYPNPFNPTTTIQFGIKDRGYVSLKIYNVAGQLVKTLVDEVKNPTPGGYKFTWNGRSDAGAPVATGVYFCKLVTSDFSRTRKLVLLK
jgi:hypothetical protein